jgi:SAM-dependent methyltransferase
VVDRESLIGHYALVTMLPDGVAFTLGRSVGRELYGQDPAAYALGRPPYPEAVYDVLRDRCHLSDDTCVLEIGPGTGLATQRFLSLGAAVTGVEPSPTLAAFLLRTLPDADLEVEAASFEDARLPDGAFDLAVAATSFHWVDPSVGPQKLRRVLRPGGWLAIWWMLFEDPSAFDDFDRAIQTVLGPSQSIVDSGPTSLQIETDARCATLRQAGFVGVRSEILRSVHTFDSTTIHALYATMAIVLRRPEPEQARVLDALQALVERDFDNLVTRTFVTTLYTAQAPASVAT